VEEAAKGARLVRFGTFEVDLRSGELRKAGVKLKLTGQPFQVLTILLEHPGEVVTREELQNRLWPNTFVDGDHNLNTAINKIREALGDSAENPRFVETLPRRGYRFLGDVETVGDGFGGLGAAHLRHPDVPRSPQNPQVQPAFVKAKGLRSLIRWLAPVLLIAIAAFFYFRHISQSPAFYSSVPLTNYAGSEICPSFAPDGERVAFAWDGEKQDNFDIYVKQIGEGTLLRLTSDPKPDLSPAWSPDGRTIAFLRLDSYEKGKILLMSSVAEGPARSLAAVTAPETLYPQSKFIAWSPDGKWLTVSDGPSYGGVMSLFLLSVETGEKRRITLPPNEYDDLDPSFSPNMRHVAFARYTGVAGSSSDLYVVNLSPDLKAEGSPERLTFYNRHIASPVWASDGRSILFTQTEPAGNHSIWRINLSGTRKSEPLPISADSSSALDISRRGSRLVYTREISNTTVWAVDLPPPKSKSSRSSNPRPWISSTQGAIEGNPQFSPDGKQVAFQSDSSGTGEIWVSDRDGSHARQLTHMGAILSGFPRWSPDGKNIVFHSRPKGLANIYVVSAEGGPAHRLDAGEVDDLTPSWSHDGKWIYFDSRETGDEQVWKMPASGGPRIQVTKRAGNVPLESADGQYLYYCTFQNTLWRVPLAGGEGAEVLAGPLAPLGSPYALGKQGIYFIRSVGQEGGQELAFLRFANHQISPIITIPRSVTFGLALSPDERLILYSQRDQVSSNLMLVENFH
jgi:Tol biopolymer transport system component/DNA-binding winged helix-turn-helix (wHTH) protein